MNGPRPVLEHANRLLAGGDAAGSERVLRKALRTDPDDPRKLFGLAIALGAQNRPAEAAEVLTRLVSVAEGFAAGHYALGNALVELNQYEKARNSYLQAISLDENLAEAYFGAGNCCRNLGQLSEAESFYRKGLDVTPDHHGCLVNLGNTLKDLRRAPEAVRVYRRALDRSPDNAALLTNLGLAEILMDRREEAEALYRKAIKLDPEYATAYINLGHLLAQQGDIVEAAKCFRTANKLRPSADLVFLADILLPPIYASEEDLHSWRKRYLAGLKKAEQSGLHLDIGQANPPGNFFIAYHGFNEKENQQRFASVYRPKAQDRRSPRVRTGAERIRIGLVSRYLRDHTIGRLNYGLIHGLNPKRFHITLFSSSGFRDKIAQSFQTRCDESILLPSHLPSARKMISDWNLDLLYYPEIGLDRFTTGLAAYHLAPVQCTTWGHPLTTGLTAMNHFLSSELLDTEDAQDHYTENLVRFSELNAYPASLDLPPLKNIRSSLGFNHDQHIYACPQSLFKLHPDFDRILSEILAHDRRGLIVLVEGKYARWNAMLQERFRKTIGKNANRIVMIPQQKRERFYHLVHSSDVCLDPVHFGGGLTSFECLAVGTPVVTLPSAYLRGRITQAWYRKIGVDGGIVSTPAEYAERAVTIAENSTIRRDLREQILQRRELLFAHTKAVQEFSDFCAGKVYRN